MPSNVILKKGREKAVLAHHHWIFSGAVAKFPQYEDGEILGVESADGKFLGRGYFNRKTSIAGRMLTFDNSDPLTAVIEKIESAAALRKLVIPKNTTGYRLVNGEGDGLPGLIVDRYDSTLVLQISTAGMEKMKLTVLDALLKIVSPSCIYEKSRGPYRKEEGIADCEEVLYGTMPEKVSFQENGFNFQAEPVHSQKTGFFFDQRDMRELTERYSKGRTVLNCFAFTGAFSVYALRGGAIRADCIDTSRTALESAEIHLEQNGFTEAQGDLIEGDAFEYLREKPPHDFVILDPPALARRKSDINSACRAYKDLNRIAIVNLPPGGLLLTCSCSHYIDESLFSQVVFQSALEAGRSVRILHKHRLAADHPINIYHPETAYLKSLFLYVD